MPRGQYDRSAAKAKRESVNCGDAALASMSPTETPDAIATLERIRDITGKAHFRAEMAVTDAKEGMWNQVADAEGLTNATDAQLTHMMDTHLRVADVQQPEPHYTRPGFPYENSPEPMTEYAAHLQGQLDEANAKIAKYSLVLKRNGLWLDE